MDDRSAEADPPVPMLPGFVTSFLQSTTGRQVLASVVAVVLAVVLRVVVLRLLRRNERMSMSERLRWSAHARNLALVVLLLGLVFIWGSELRDFVVSLVVLASALVLGTKELLMCVSGSIVRATSRSFEVGDRIEVAGIRGDVIDHGVLGTTLLEIGPGHQRTGRTQVIPNSLFLSNPIANETFTERYVLHTFGVPLAPGESWQAAERRLLEIANTLCAEHAEAARKHMDLVSERHGLTSFDVTPRVTLHPEGQQLCLRVRIPTPARERGRLEQEVMRLFYEEPEPLEREG